MENLEAQVSELQGKTITKQGSSMKIAAPVSSEQFPRQCRRTDPTSNLNKGTFDSHLQEVSNEYYSRTRGALPPVRWRKGTFAMD